MTSALARTCQRRRELCRWTGEDVNQEYHGHCMLVTHYLQPQFEGGFMARLNTWLRLKRKTPSRPKITDEELQLLINTFSKLMMESKDDVYSAADLKFCTTFLDLTSWAFCLRVRRAHTDIVIGMATKFSTKKKFVIDKEIRIVLHCLTKAVLKKWKRGPVAATNNTMVAKAVVNIPTDSPLIPISINETEPATHVILIDGEERIGAEIDVVQIPVDNGAVVNGQEREVQIQKRPEIIVITIEDSDEEEEMPNLVPEVPIPLAPTDDDNLEVPAHSDEVTMVTLLRDDDEDDTGPPTLDNEVQDLEPQPDHGPDPAHPQLMKQEAGKENVRRRAKRGRREKKKRVHDDRNPSPDICDFNVGLLVTVNSIRRRGPPEAEAQDDPCPDMDNGGENEDEEMGQEHPPLLQAETTALQVDIPIGIIKIEPGLEEFVPLGNLEVPLAHVQLPPPPVDQIDLPLPTPLVQIQQLGDEIQDLMPETELDDLATFEINVEIPRVEVERGFNPYEYLHPERPRGVVQESVREIHRKADKVAKKQRNEWKAKILAVSQNQIKRMSNSAEMEASIKSFEEKMKLILAEQEKALPPEMKNLNDINPDYSSVENALVETVLELGSKRKASEMVSHLDLYEKRISTGAGFKRAHMDFYALTSALGHRKLIMKVPESENSREVAQHSGISIEMIKSREVGHELLLGSSLDMDVEKLFMRASDQPDKHDGPTRCKRRKVDTDALIGPPPLTPPLSTTNGSEVDTSVTMSETDGVNWAFVSSGVGVNTPEWEAWDPQLPNQLDSSSFVTPRCAGVQASVTNTSLVMATPHKILTKCRRQVPKPQLRTMKLLFPNSPNRED